MKKLRAKLKKIKADRWSKRTLGEKIVSVILTLLKGAVIVVTGSFGRAEKLHADTWTWQRIHGLCDL